MNGRLLSRVASFVAWIMLAASSVFAEEPKYDSFVKNRNFDLSVL